MKADLTWLEADCDNGCRPIPGTNTCPTCAPPEDWLDRIACRDQSADVFFGGAAADKIAIKICATCPVRGYCLEKGWDEEYGVWGGIPEGHRRHLNYTMKLDMVPRRERRRAIRELAARPFN